VRRLALLLVALAVVPAALAGGAADPGVTASTVTIGGTVPISGPAALFGSVGRGADAYLKYVNASGGVNGRKIRYLYLDDGYDPAKTVQLTRQLVEQDRVFAIFNTVGTDNNLAIRDYLNAAKVPQLFVGTGVNKIGDDYRSHPWTIGYLPSFRAEGVIYGRYIAKTRPGAKIAVLYENSDYGKDLTSGLRKGLGAKAGAIVDSEAYEPTDTAIESQMASLHSSGADTLVLNATPQYVILAYLAAHKFGWHPQIFVSSVSISPNVMDIVRASVGKDANGSVSIAFVKDPTDRVWAKDPVVALYRKILKQYAPGAKFTDVYNFYGMAVAYSMVDALKHAGKSLTRASLLRAATHLDETNPFMRPGIKIQTSPRDYYPITRAQPVRYATNHWVAFGGLVSARG
jgi:branched-chain amino acid transport system substrate-binding protein